MKDSNSNCFLLLPKNQTDMALLSLFHSKEEAEKAQSILVNCAKIPCTVLKIEAKTALEHKEMLLDKIKNDFLESFSSKKRP